MLDQLKTLTESSYAGPIKVTMNESLWKADVANINLLQLSPGDSTRVFSIVYHLCFQNVSLFLSTLSNVVHRWKLPFTKINYCCNSSACIPINVWKFQTDSKWSKYCQDIFEHFILIQIEPKFGTLSLIKTRYCQQAAWQTESNIGSSGLCQITSKVHLLYIFPQQIKNSQNSKLSNHSMFNLLLAVPFFDHPITCMQEKCHFLVPYYNTKIGQKKSFYLWLGNNFKNSSCSQIN